MGCPPVGTGRMAFRYSTQEASHGELTYQFSPECSSKITATCRRLTALKSSENLTTMVKQCRALFCPSARKSQPADRPRKGLKHPLIRRNIAGAVGISSLSWPCMYLGFLAMYRGMKSIKHYNSKILFPAHL